MRTRSFYRMSLVLVAILLIAFTAFCGIGLMKQSTESANATGVHTHCICGASSCADHGGAVTWTAWSASDSLPYQEGYYYLTQNVTITKQWTPNLHGIDDCGTKMFLCLNGFTVTGVFSKSGNYSDVLISVMSGGTLTITDCKGTGVLTAHDNGNTKITGLSDMYFNSVMAVRLSAWNSVMNLYGGTFSGFSAALYGSMMTGGVVNMYGGAIKNNSFSTSCGIKGNGTFNMYGGEISGNSTTNSGFFGGTFNMYGGTITGNSGSGASVFSQGVYSLYGGEITGNISGNGKGIVHTFSSFSVGKDACVVGNKNGDIVLDSGKVLTVLSGDNAPTSQMKVGVGSTVALNESNNYQVAFTGTNTANYSGSFAPSSDVQCIVNTDNVLYLDASHGHYHSVCCDGSCAEHDALTWTAWSAADSLPYQEGYYYLTQDVTITKQWTPNLHGIDDCGTKMFLCLNGHTVTGVFSKKNNYTDVLISVISGGTLTITDCKGTGVLTAHDNGSTKITGLSDMYLDSVMAVRLSDSSSVMNLYGGTFSGFSAALYGSMMTGGVVNMYGGAIKNNSFSTGCCIKGNGTFNMYGGEITGNSTTNSGFFGGTFNMYGGTITGNSGSGASVFSKGVFSLYGGKITGNISGNGKGIVYTFTSFSVGKDAYVSGNTNGNIVLDSGKVLTVLSGDNAPTSQMKVGVGSTVALNESNGYKIAVATVSDGVDYSANFIGDNLAENASIEYVVADSAICIKMHSHCVCNKTNCVCDSGTKIWTPLTDALPTAAGYYYMTQDITLSSTWTAVNNVYLDLNGYKLTSTEFGEYTTAARGSMIEIGSDILFTMTDCKGTGTVVPKCTGTYVDGKGYGGKFMIFTGTNGFFEMYGGTVTGVNMNCSADSSGAVITSKDSLNVVYLFAGAFSNNKTNKNAAVAENVKFLIYGGSVSGNSAVNGAAFADCSLTVVGGTITGNTASGAGSVCYNGSIDITGGEISGNKAASGGIYTSAKWSFGVGGSAIVKDNIDNDNNVSNLIIPKEKLLDVSAFYSGAVVHVATTETIVDGDSAAGTKEVLISYGGGAYFGGFVCDNPGNYVVAKGSDLYIVGAHKHEKNLLDTDDTTVYTWTYTSVLPTASGYYALAGTVKATDNWILDGNVTVYLCMNLNDIDMNGHYIVIEKGSALMLTDCGGTELSCIKNGNGTTSPSGGFITVSGQLNHTAIIIGTDTTTGGNISLNGTVVLNDSSAVYTMKDAYIYSNTATNKGGAVSVLAGTFTADNSRLERNEVTNNTSGVGTVYMEGGSVKLLNCTIKENGIATASDLYASKQGVYVKGGTFAVGGGGDIQAVYLCKNNYMTIVNETKQMFSALIPVMTEEDPLSTSTKRIKIANYHYNTLGESTIRSYRGGSTSVFAYQSTLYIGEQITYEYNENNNDECAVTISADIESVTNALENSHGGLEYNRSASLKNSDNEKATSTVVVRYYVTVNTGISGMYLDLEYDPAAMSVASVTVEDFFDGQVSTIGQDGCKDHILVDMLENDSRIHLMDSDGNTAPTGFYLLEVTYEVSAWKEFGGDYYDIGIASDSYATIKDDNTVTGHALSKINSIPCRLYLQIGGGITGVTTIATYNTKEHNGIERDGDIIFTGSTMEGDVEISEFTFLFVDGRGTAVPNREFVLERWEQEDGTELTGGPVDAGTYYVVVKAEETMQYAGTISDPIEITIQRYVLDDMKIETGDDSHIVYKSKTKEYTGNDITWTADAANFTLASTSFLPESILSGERSIMNKASNGDFTVTDFFSFSVVETIPEGYDGYTQRDCDAYTLQFMITGLKNYGFTADLEIVDSKLFDVTVEITSVANEIIDRYTVEDDEYYHKEGYSEYKLTTKTYDTKYVQFALKSKYNNSDGTSALTLEYAEIVDGQEGAKQAFTNESLKTAGVYKVYATIPDTTNYTGDSAAYEVTINKVTPEDFTASYTTAGKVGFTDPTKQSDAEAFPKTASDEDVTFSYYYSNDALVTAYTDATALTGSELELTASGTYTFWCVPSDTTNFAVLSATKNAYKITFAEGTHEKQASNWKNNEGAVVELYRFDGQTYSFDIDTCKMTLVGYTAKSFDSSALSLTEQTPAVMTAKTVSTDDTVTPNWSINKWNVTWKNTDANSTQLAQVEYSYCDAYAYPNATPTKPDVGDKAFTFVGWSTDASAEPDAVMEEADFVLADAAVTLYAVYSSRYNEFKVIVKLYVQKNDGSYEPAGTEDLTSAEKIKVGTSEDLNTLLATANKNLYKLFGYYTEISGTTLTGKTDVMIEPENEADQKSDTATVTLCAYYAFNIGLGDVNGDGNVNTDDVTLYRQILVGGYKITTIDVDKEFETVTASDYDASATYFLKRVADVYEDSTTYDIRDVAVIRMAMVGGYGYAVVSGVSVVGEEVSHNIIVKSAAQLASALTMYPNEVIHLGANITVEDLVIEYTNGKRILDLATYTLTIEGELTVSSEFSVENGTISAKFIGIGADTAMDGITIEYSGSEENTTCDISVSGQDVDIELTDVSSDGACTVYVASSGMRIYVDSETAFTKGITAEVLTEDLTIPVVPTYAFTIAGEESKVTIHYYEE